MPAPVVEDLTKIMAELDPGFAPTRNLYNQQLAGVPAELAATNQGIEADKNLAFSGIAKGANSRGLDFFGTPIEEQSKYLGGTYLTSKNNAIAANTNKQMTLQQALAQLEQDRYKTAFSTRQGQQSAADTYQAQQEKMAFEAQQAALDRTAKANSPSAPPQWAIKQADVAALAQALQPKKGGDGYVSPTTYSNAKSEWVKNGYSSSEFDQYFSNLRDPKNKYYKVG